MLSYSILEVNSKLFKLLMLEDRKVEGQRTNLSKTEARDACRMTWLLRSDVFSYGTLAHGMAI